MSLIRKEAILKFILHMFFGGLLIFSRQVFGGELQIFQEFGKVVDQCQAKSSGKMVWIFKQWHPSPSVNTKKNNEIIPQEKNQTAIFKQLDQWVSKSQVSEVIAEGCSGELDEKSNIQFNGWSIKDLNSAVKETNFPEIVTSVALKLEAKYGKKLLTKCGDDEALIKENSLAFSDARGAIGFLTRLQQFDPNSDSGKSYLKSVVSLYKLPADATLVQAQTRLKQELKSSISRLQAALDKRNRKVLESIKPSQAKSIVIIFGGLHAKGIKDLVEQEGFSCKIFEPVGYQDEENGLLKKLNEVAQSL